MQNRELRVQRRAAHNTLRRCAGWRCAGCRRAGCCRARPFGVRPRALRRPRIGISRSRLQRHAPGRQMSPRIQIGHHGCRSSSRARQPVPRSLLLLRIQHLIPALQVELLGRHFERRLAWQAGAAVARKARAAGHCDLADVGRSVAQRKALAVELRPGRGDLHRLAQSRHLGASVLQHSASAHRWAVELQPGSVESQIHIRRSAQRNPRSPDSRCPRQLLQALQTSVTLQVQAVVRAFQLALHAHRRGSAQRQLEALQHQAVRVLRFCLFLLRAPFRAGKLRVGRGHNARQHQLLAQYAGAQHQPANLQIPHQLRRRSIHVRRAEARRQAPLRVQILRQSGTRSPRQAHQVLGRHVVGADHQIPLRMAQPSGQSAHAQHAAAQRQAAVAQVQFLQAQLRHAVACRIQRGGVIRSHVVAAQLAQPRRGGKVQLPGGSAQLRAGIQLSAPAAIFAVDQPRQVPQLHLLPGHAGLQRSVAQHWGALNRHLALDGARVGHRHVGTHRLGGQPHVPLAFRRAEQRKVGLGQAEGALFQSVLEVDASVAGLDVGEAGASHHGRGCGRSGLRARRPPQQRLQIPLALAALHQVQAGILQVQPCNLQPSAPQRTQSQIGRHFVGAQQRFRAVRGVVAHH